MNDVFLTGLIILFGFLLGELANRIKLPKVSGYILAGLILSPQVSPFMPVGFVKNTSVATDISLGIITFSVGGTLLIKKIKESGRKIFKITLFESLFSFLFVSVFFVFISSVFFDIENATFVNTYIPFALLLGALAVPTDPTATLAVAHEYKAKGKVISTIMGVAAFDDALGIVFFSIGVAFASILISNETLDFVSVGVEIGRELFGAVLIGGISGIIFNEAIKLLRKKTEGILIVLIVGFLALSFGAASVINADELLANMFMGFIVVNYNKESDLIFKVLERYTEKLVFILFFTLSGMHLDIFVLTDYIHLVLFYVIIRAFAKYTGVFVGSSKNDKQVRKYTGSGLIPQGGIVIGLALMIKQNPDFSVLSNEFINIVLGATIIHEVFGPVISKFALKRAGEIE